MEGNDFTVTVVGMGLIGASYALALRKLNFKNIWGIDICEETLIKAEERGIIDKGYVNPLIPLKNSDLVIIAVYPKETISFMINNANNFKAGAIVTDAAGLKAEIINKIKSVLPKTVDFIGGHPMAGKESSGIDMASEEIFVGANYILTPIETNVENNVNFLTKLAYDLGCKNVIKIDPETHDSIISYTSQLPHVLAATMINSNKNININSFIGNGFKDCTRIAINNSALWTELLLQNKKYLITTIEDYQKEIEELKQALIDNNEVFIKDKFENANRKRKEIV